MNVEVLGVITARGGSKGIPRKNLRLVAGKPLIAWTIDVAISSKFLNRVIVSTDDDDIAKVSREYGAEVPFIRPSDLATDEASSIDVILHALELLENHESYRPDYVMLLQPTSPLRISEDIDTAIIEALEKNAESTISVCETDYHPYLIKKLRGNGTLEDFVDTPKSIHRRQEYPPTLALNGAIYLVKHEVLLKEQTFYPENRTYPFIMPPEHSLDVDTLWDLYLVDLILKDRNDSKSS